MIPFGSDGEPATDIFSLPPLSPNCPAILRRTIVLCLVSLAAIGLVAGCGGSTQTTPEDVDNERTIGSPAVYARIEASTNCVDLQREFDIAGDNTDRIQDSGGDASIPMSYMDAANNRMREVGCYG